MRLSIEKYADQHHQAYTNEIPRNLELLFRTNKFNSILDAGCGDGGLIKAMVEREQISQEKITGLDLSSKRIGLVKKLFPKVRTLVDSVERLSKVKSNSIDLLISTQVIEHVDDVKMVKSLSRVVKKGGLVYLTTVFRKWYGRYIYRVNNQWLLDPTHLREYSEFSQLTNLLNRNFYITHHQLEPLRYPVIDMLFNLFKYRNRNRTGYFWQLIRFLRIPILGYYNWEIILVKK